MPTGNSVPTWKDVAETTGFRQRGECAVCRLAPDVREQVEDAWANGMRLKFLSEIYLPSAGIRNVSGSSISHHFAAGHHDGP